MSRRARQRLPAIAAKRATAWSGPDSDPVDDSEGGQPDARAVWWLVEEFTREGQSTGHYMLDQGALTITTDVNAARKLRRQQSAGFRALDMEEQHGGDWRPVEHSFEETRPMCACFPGTCRGGQVVNGKLSNGQCCKAQVPAARPNQR